MASAPRRLPHRARCTQPAGAGSPRLPRTSDTSDALALRSQTEDVRLDLGIVVEEHVAVLTDVGDSAEGVTAVVRFQRILRVDIVTREFGRRLPLVLAVPPDTRVRWLGDAQVRGHRRIVPVAAVVEHRGAGRVSIELPSHGKIEKLLP